MVKVGWWAGRAAHAPLERGCPRIAAELVFPSGRAAIAQCLEAIDLPADATVAVPHTSSDCLRRVVSRFGRPVDFGALHRGMPVAVVYEQWGWPLPEEAWQEVIGRFTGRLLVVDRVDSADMFLAAPADGALPSASVEVFSLSKLLGIAGGGLARADSGFIAFVPQPDSASMRQLRTRSPADLERRGYTEMFKENRHEVHPAVLSWLRQNCLETAAEDERMARRRHIATLQDTQLAEGWPAWMLQTLARGAGPVWAPVLRGHDAQRRWTAMSMLDQRLGLVSASRLFNWSGNPLRPEYEMCLALPVHGEVADFGDVLAAID